MADMTTNWKATLSRSTRGPALFGYGAIAAMLGTFGLWGATAPISGAAVAAGTIAAAGRNIQMQHLEGALCERSRFGRRCGQPRVMILDDTARQNTAEQAGEAMGIAERPKSATGSRT